MTRRRFIADEISGDRAVLTNEHADHLARVLRARVGQEFDIATGVCVRRGRIVSVRDDRVEFTLGEEISTPDPTQVTLLLAIFKFDRMEWAIEKCTELGVSRILPLITRRTEAHLAAASGKRAERWGRIARQASEQSRRAAPPEISAPIKMAEGLNLPAALRIVLAEAEEQTLLGEAINPDTAKDSVVLAVGPEGGWTDDELSLFLQAGWVSASLGDTILRAETAAIAAAAIVMSALSTKVAKDATSIAP